VRVEEIEEAPFSSKVGKYRRFGTSQPPLEEIEEIEKIVAVMQSVRERFRYRSVSGKQNDAKTCLNKRLFQFKTVSSISAVR
jgi:hypothetical protein